MNLNPARCTPYLADGICRFRGISVLYPCKGLRGCAPYDLVRKSGHVFKLFDQAIHHVKAALPESCLADIDAGIRKDADRRI